MGCYAASSGKSLPMFRDNLPVPSSGLFLNNEDGTDRLSRNVGKDTTTHCVTTQKSADLI